MPKLNPKVDLYLAQGCGRCSLGGTPECKVHTWPKPLKELRRIVLECGLVEELKWSVPCYTDNKRNIAIIAAFKDYCSLSFFKGALLKDEAKVLEKPGENSQSARLIRFTTVHAIQSMEPLLKDYLREAVEIENSGLKVDFKAKNELVLPEELQYRFESYPELQTAFYALTPGRQRGYVLYFSAAKQSSTRASRIEKCIDSILAGKGWNEQ